MSVNRRYLLLGATSSLIGVGVYPLANSFLDTSQELAKQAQEMAARDKSAAIAQMAAQIADNSSETDTLGFTNLTKEYPWLDQSRKNVGIFRDGEYPYGTAVLIDHQGTVALAAHEFTDKQHSISFYPSHNRQEHKVIPCDFKRNKAFDLMFATIDQPSIEQFGLVPVRWGQIGYNNEKIGQEVIAVGWPGESARLHATKGKVSDFKETIIASGNIEDCKIESDNPNFHGMSGGAVFHDQLWVGIFNAGTDLGINTKIYFTPVDLIRAAYIELYPDRAQKEGILPQQVTDSPTVPEACQLKGHTFLSALTK